MNLHNTCSTAAHDSIGQELSKEAVEKEKEKIRKNEKIEKERERKGDERGKGGEWQMAARCKYLCALSIETPDSTESFKLYPFPSLAFK